MDENGVVQPDLRKFSRPFCLLSLAFFLPYVFILCILFGRIAGPELGRYLSPSTGYIVLEYLTIAVCGLVYLISCAGALLVLREMRDVSSARAAAVPLCILSCMMGISAIFFIIPPGYFGQFHNQITIYSMVIFLCGFMSLPYGSDYLLRGFRGRGFDRIQRELHHAGLFGLVVSTGLLVIVILLTSTWIEDLIPLLIIALLFCLVNLFIVMPVIGIEMFRYGIGFLKEPSGGD